MRSLAPLLLTGLLLGILSCGVNIDVSNLEFEPATKDVTTPDKEVAPADALGDVVPPDTADVAPVDAGPDAVTPQKCWQVYECVVYEKGGWDLELKKFQQCGAEVVNNKLTSPPVSELYKCLDICMINDNMEEFGNCLMTNCIGYTLKCVHDSAPGDKTCADALMCLVEECSEIEPTPGNELDC